MGLIKKIRDAPFKGFQDVSITYNGLSVFYDPLQVFQQYGKSPLTYVEQWLNNLAKGLMANESGTAGRDHIIPVCYEAPYSPDLEAVAVFHKVSPEEIIYGHQSTVYYVFMVGFSPGFPYLGLVSEFLETPRKSTPTLSVPAGSVGIAGRQTGIYSFTSPGGWNIIGRTPLRMFNINDPALCLLQAGDSVTFSSIDAQTFYYLNQYADT